MDDIKEYLKDLIIEGREVKERNYHASRDEWFSDYISGEEYERWISKCIAILNDNFPSHPLTSKFMEASEEAVGGGESYFNTMIGVLQALKETVEKSFETNIFKGENFEKIFISHSSKDKEYVELLIQLLNDMGIPKNNDYIFCSSLEGYNIPLGKKIYDYIKKQFNQNIMVLCVLSKNYYNSVPCLNEMGATWVTSREYQSILLPHFEFSNIEGAIDPTKVSFKMNNKERLNTFKDKIINSFGLNEIDTSVWERDRDDFLEKIENLSRRDKYNNSLIRVDVERVKENKNGEIEIDLRFINEGETPVEFQELSIKLYDDEGNLLEFEPREFLHNYILYGAENRREVTIVSNTDRNYNPRRNKKWEININPITAY
ncbi:toll/interleukin-1 receptor domain-containing protein [Fuchsiella alkaliacetigena]|uniref:toll/interleukin-1 receptor domain-containing protein n=1 Tax=Fuchsiella alkaliacetigena TaxID=957042 RepID=UPI00200B26A4|nr:toll/interleukin-1 receptor domain-containing protein [Fuchsiella alkaliacetigena]MCK8824686.1 toll/interleukin-1 receptor domain-containing protein [Fuchsiella alkaliacetigena]